MTKPIKWITALELLLLFLLLAALAAFRLPYLLAGSDMPEDSALEIDAQPDGTLTLTWTEAARADAYLVTITDADGAELRSGLCVSNGCTLHDLEYSGTATVLVQSARYYQTPSGNRLRRGGQALTASCSLASPSVSDLTAVTDIAEKSIAFHWTAVQGDTYTLSYSLNGGAPEVLRELSSGTATVRFGDGGDLAMLHENEEAVFYLSAQRSGDNYTVRGAAVSAVSVVRDDLLGTQLVLTATDEGDNFYTLTWNETRGEWYAVQQETADGTWETLAEYSIYDLRSYSTGHLDSFTDYTFRVIACGADTLEGSEFAAYPGEAHLTTGASTLYATVWPLMDLPLYADAEQTNISGTASAAQALCVVGETNGLFRVYTALGAAYIDSRYCMINLPDYLGDLVSYDIKNSYASIYMVHEYGIPEITGTVITGYEDVLTDTDDTYLVPLLYPTAQKLLSAAQTVQQDGLRLKIYDSYRPRQATRFLYDQTSAILYDPLPQQTFAEMTEVPWLDAADTQTDADEISERPALTVFESETAGEGNETSGADKADTQTQTGGQMTYYRLMTNGVYGLNSFLASVGSYHNMGIALDLTLETLDTRTELEMQTSMHDLSCYSVVSANNDNASHLALYMTGAGFGTLSSEWWHFQDNELRQTLELTTFLEVGVSPEGWKADENGVRYRLADGSYYTSCKAIVGGTAYSFDANGYLAD